MGRWTDIASAMFQEQTPPLSQEAQEPASNKRSSLGEIWSQLKAGAFVDLPRMIGQGMKYSSTPDGKLYDIGKGLVEDSAAISTLPEMQPSATSDDAIAGSLAKGARMIPLSVAPAVGAGLMLTGVGAPAGAAILGGAALSAIPAAMAQGQETYEKGLQKHSITQEQAAAMPDDPRVQEAMNAGRMNAGIEWGGETAGGALAGRFMGIGGTVAKGVIGKMLNRGEQTAAQGVLKSFTNPGTVGRFAGNALETAAGETLVEMGQGAAQAAVEQQHGYDQQTPWDAAKETIAPTLGMSALLAPFGIPAHASHAVKMNAITSALQNPEITPELRSQAAEIIYNEMEKSSPAAAENFAAHAFDAIHGTEETGSAPYGLSLDDRVLHPLTPHAIQIQEAEQRYQGEKEAGNTLSSAIAAGEVAAVKSNPGALAVDFSPAINQEFNPQQEPTPNNLEMPDQQRVEAAASTPRVLPFGNLHPSLQTFLQLGEKRTAESGETSQVWQTPNRLMMEKTISGLQAAAEQGEIAQDAEGAYIINTDRGNLRLLPPADTKGDYRLEYQRPVSQVEQIAPASMQTGGVETAFTENSESTTLAPVVNDLSNEKPENSLASVQGIVTPAPFTETPPESKFTLSRASVENAFPGQNVTDDVNGYRVTLKNGSDIKVSATGEIGLDTSSSDSGKPVAEFRKIGKDAVISLTEQGAGEIHHETFHAAMATALNPNQRRLILERYGTEEKAAAAYQAIRDGNPIQKSVPLQVMHRFFQKVSGMFNPSSQVMNDIATGAVWNESQGERLNPLQQRILGNLQTRKDRGEPLTGYQQNAFDKLTAIAEGTNSTAPVYSIADIQGKAKSVAAHLERISSKSTFMQQDVQPAMQAAGEGIAASWDGIKAAIAPMTRTPEAEEAGRILIESMGKQEHSKEKFINSLNAATLQASKDTTKLAKALDLMKTSTTLADKLFASMPEADRISFMQKMDTGERQATKELQQVADTIKAMFEQKAKAVQNLGTGALETIRENYFPHVWDRSSEAQKEINVRLSKRPLEGSKGFTKARTFDDINAGIEAGFKLVDTNPINLVMLKMAEMDRYLNAHVALQAMEESGLVQLIPAGEKMPDGYGDISGKYGLVTKRAHQDAASGMPGEMKSYRYIAREDVAQVFNNYLSQNLYNNKYIGKPFTAYMKAANMLNQFQLGVFSAFHAGFTSLEAVISHAALGIKAATRGDMKEAGKYFKEAPAAWYSNPKLGDKVIKAWMGDEAAAKEMPQVIEWLQMAGARRIMDSRFQTDQTQKMFQAWNEGNKIGAGLRTIPAIVEQSARPILEWLVPRQKLGVFTEMANEWSQRHQDATHEETRKAMQQIWNRVDSRLGQVVYDRLFVHNVAKNVTQALVRAPGWTGGTILEVGGGLKDIGAFAKDAAAGKKPELTDRAAYTISLMLTTALANTLLTAAFTGEPPEDWKDLLAFRTGRKDEKGNPERFMLPTYAKDLYAYAQKPGTTLLHKSHPLLSLIGDIARNKDFYGTEIRHQGDNPVMQLAQVAGFTAKAFIPFWMKGAAKEYERGGNVASMAAPLIGIMPAPAALNQTKAEQLASQLVADRMPKGTKTQEQFERGQLIQHLTGLARRDREQAGKEVREALKEKQITMIQARHIFQNATLAPIQVAFKRLSYEEAQRVFEVATDEEKKKLRILLTRKKLNQRKQGNG